MNAIAIPDLRTLGSAIVALAFACAGCSSPMVQDAAKPSGAATPGSSATGSYRTKEPPATPKAAAASKGNQELERGIRSYEEGAYKNAARQFQAALDLGLDAKSDQAAAHKYLAFVVCVSGREKACRDEFRKAVDADSSFELSPAEAGHPIWAAVLRTVKSETTIKPKPK